MRNNSLVFAAVVLLILFLMTSCEEKNTEAPHKGITPDEVLTAYNGFSSLPRSGETYPADIHLYISEYMKKIGINTETDSQGNLSAYIPPTGKYAKEKPLVVLCNTYGEIISAPDSNRKPTDSAIAKLSKDRKTISAEGSSMAAGSSAAIAAALTAANHIMEDAATNKEHRAVRFIFSSKVRPIDLSAYTLRSDWLSGQLLVSLDGAGTSNIATSAKYAAVLKSDMKLKQMKTQAKHAYVIAASGYPGARFGSDKDVENPINALTEILSAVNNSGILYSLCSIDAGDNVLEAPKEATAIIAMNDYEQKRFLNVVQDVAASIDDTGERISVTQTTIPEYSVPPADTGKIVTQLYSFTTSDFTAENKNLVGVFTGNVKLTSSNFSCKSLVVATDKETVDAVSEECNNIQVLSGIPIEKTSVISGFSTPDDNKNVETFIRGYADAEDARIKVSALGMSSLGSIATKIPELPIVSIGISVHQRNTPYESIDFADLAYPANAIADYIFPDTTDITAEES